MSWGLKRSIHNRKANEPGGARDCEAIDRAFRKAKQAAPKVAGGVAVEFAKEAIKAGIKGD